jgi:hypothetical protein
MPGASRLFLIAGALLGSVAFLAPHAWSQSDIRNASRESADDIWRKLTEITDLRGQRPSRADVEQSFDAHLTELPVQPSFGGRAFAARNPHYDVQIDEMHDGGRHFMFFWSGTTAANLQAFPPPPDGMCIARQVVMQTLAQPKWTVVARSNAVQENWLGMSHVSLQSGHTLLDIDFTIETNCLVALSMQTGAPVERP